MRGSGARSGIFVNDIYYVNELSVIQKAYDLMLWYIPTINRLPQSKFTRETRIAGLCTALSRNLFADG